VVVFGNILIPISSEFYSRGVLEKGAFLAECFGSKVTIVYIIEEKTLTQTEKRSDTFRTRFEKEETKKGIIDSQTRTANVIIFFEAKAIFKEKGIIPNFKIVEGEFSTVIAQEIAAQHVDVVLMGYTKEGLLRYRIFDEIAIPLWIVGSPGDRRMLAVCSNLTPNQKIPEMSFRLAQCFNWDLHLLYIVDIGEPLAFDESVQRFVKRPVSELLDEGQRFVDAMGKKGIAAQMVTGGFQEATLHTAKQLNPGLVVMGQEQKRYDILGFPVKSMSHRIVEKSKYSMLFLK